LGVISAHSSTEDPHENKEIKKNLESQFQIIYDHSEVPFENEMNYIYSNPTIEILETQLNLSNFGDKSVQKRKIEQTQVISDEMKECNSQKHPRMANQTEPDIKDDEPSNS